MSSSDESQVTVIRAPSRLTYKIDGLPEETQAAVRDAFREPPRIALQCCGIRDKMYAFQMTELKTMSIRIGSPDSNFPVPKCSCGKVDPPCRHVLWLLDQVVKHTQYGHNPHEPLTLKPEGYAEEMGDPFQDISTFHLNILADSLHCEVLTPDSDDHDDEAPNPHRVQEARELLAAIAVTSPDDYRPDIFSNPSAGKKPIKRGDLECTVFRMLLANNEFFHYVLSLARSSDPVNNPFRKLDQRVDRVLADLDAYSADPSAPTTEIACNVEWAARHLLGVVTLVRTAIFRRDAPLEPWERDGGARTLVRILSAVCERNHDAHPGASRVERNLYLRLVGDQDHDFVIGVLNLLPDAASGYVHNLEDISEQLGVHGAPATYVEKFRSLLARLRSQSSGTSRAAGSKRQGTSPRQDRLSKRMK